jgi:UDP-N-acetylmuramoyl-L-alanyl-D-glutamate--2,6-diaminopimelate ligase
VRADALRARLESAGLLAAWPEGVPAELPGVATDSRKVPAGGLFMAYAGSTADGHAYVPAAVHAGAGAVLVEHEVGGVPAPQIRVTSGRHAAALVAALACGDPADGLTLLAATGTNGKTTSVHLLRHLFGDTAPAASIGTLGAVGGDGAVLPGTENLTTPGPVELQVTLAALKASGVTVVAMEASSHSLDQDRLHGLRFQAAVFTNLTRDHLDYHRTEEAYRAAKLKLVDLVAADGWLVSNADDAAWATLADRPRHLSFGLTHGEVRADQIEGDARGMRFTLTARGQAARLRLPLLGHYNVENALGAAAAALALGRPLAQVAARLGTVPQVPGRMERLAEKPCVVLRDYAHTPDALARALAAVRPLTRGRVLAVFGCGGDRDRGKRAVMGGIAAREADIAIVTSDNPRTEDPGRILDEIEEGMGETPHLRIVDRRQAIQRALTIARPDDVILLAGKGHETYQILGTEKFPFDERDVVADMIGALPA